MISRVIIGINNRYLTSLIFCSDVTLQKRSIQKFPSFLLFLQRINVLQRVQYIKLFILKIKRNITGKFLLRRNTALFFRQNGITAVRDSFLNCYIQLLQSCRMSCGSFDPRFAPGVIHIWLLQSLSTLASFSYKA